MALRANVLAKGYSGIRRSTLEALIETAQPARAPASCRAAARSAPAATSRRSRTSRWCSSAKGTRRSATCGRAAGTGRAARRRADAGGAAGQGRARAHQRHAAVDGGRRARRRRRRAARRAPPTSPRRCRSTRCAARCNRSTRAFTTRGRTPASARRPPTSGGCSPAAPSTSRTSTAAGCRTPTRSAARRRCTARRATRCASVQQTLSIEANGATDNPMVFADGRRDRLGRQLSRRADRRRRRSAARLRSSQLATISERRSDRLVNPALERSAGVPARPTAACTRAT